MIIDFIQFEKGRTANECSRSTASFTEMVALHGGDDAGPHQVGSLKYFIDNIIFIILFKKRAIKCYVIILIGYTIILHDSPFLQKVYDMPMKKLQVASSLIAPR